MAAHPSDSWRARLSRRRALGIGAASVGATVVAAVPASPAGAQTATALDDLSDVTTTGSSAGDLLAFDGTVWRPDDLRSQLALNVRDFGAVGDGSTDDTAEVTAAVAAAMSSQRALYFPAGSYVISGISGLLVDSPLTLFADRDAELIGAGAGSNTACVFDVRSSVVCTGLSFRATTTPFSLVGGSAVAIDDLVIDRCRFVNGSSPVSVNANSSSTIGRVQLTSNVVEGCRYGVLLPAKGLGSVVALGNRIDDVGLVGLRFGYDDPIYHDANHRIVVNGNVVTRVHPTDGGTECNGIVVMGARAVICDNVVHQVTDGSSGAGTDIEGIYVKGHDVVIEGNNLSDAGTKEGAITCKQTGRVRVAGNVVASPTSVTNTGVNLQCKAADVTGNTITGMREFGVYVQGSNWERGSHTITGNVFRRIGVPNVPAIAVRLSGEGDIHVEGNTFIDLGTSGTAGSSGVSVGPHPNLTTGNGSHVTRRVRIGGNAFMGIAGNDSRAIILGAGTGETIDEVMVSGNQISDVARGINFSKEGTGVISNVLMDGNLFHNVAAPYVNTGHVTGLARFDSQLYALTTGNGSGTKGPSVFGGSGAPSSSLGATGDYYFRSGAPTTSLQRVYVRTSSGWQGIV